MQIYKKKILIDLDGVLNEYGKEKFDENYAMFCQKESMQELQERYNELLVNKEVVVRVLDPKGEYEGVAHGINEKGELLVERNDGILEAIYAGEVSVRGIYGYV